MYELQETTGLKLVQDLSYATFGMKFKAFVHQAEEGGYWAEVPALLGCITEGNTWEDLMANLKDAIQGWLEVEG